MKNTIYLQLYIFKKDIFKSIILYYKKANNIN